MAERILTSINYTDYGLAFELVNNEATVNEATVVQLYDRGTDNDSWDVQIPSTISYDSQSYTVTSITFIGGRDEMVSVSIPNSVTTIGYEAFSGCTSLTSITIPDSVTTIGYAAFSGCTKLTSVNISDIAPWCNISFGSYESNPLYYAKNLYRNGELVTDLVIPDEVTSIRDYAFINCESVKSATIPSSVTSVGIEVFVGCNSLETIVIPSLTLWDNKIDTICHLGWLFGSYANYDQNDEFVPKSLKTVTITNAETIPDYAFYNCKNLTSITIPDSVTSIGSYAFYGCTGLTSITIPDNVTIIGSGAFCDCLSLIDVYITDLRAWCNIDFGDEYSNGLHNGSLYLKNNNEYNEIKSITSEQIAGITAIKDYVFTDLSSLENIEIPSTVTSIGDWAFYNCNSLTSITIPDSVTRIDDCAFLSCTRLTSISIGNSVTSIGSGTFSGCTSLISIVIPDGVTTIGSYAFSGCDNITNITIGKGVISIGEDAFYGCGNLSNIYYKGTKYQRDNYIKMDGSNNHIKDKIWYYSLNGRLKMGDGFKDIAEVFTIVEGNKKVITNISKI